MKTFLYESKQKSLIKNDFKLQRCDEFFMIFQGEMSGVSHVCGALFLKFHCLGAHFEHTYLVDPASSHMLVSKIKPCMSKYKQLYTVKLRKAHYISYSLFDSFLLWITVVILELIHATKPDARRAVFIRYKANIKVIQNNLADRFRTVHHSNFCPINFRW